METQTAGDRRILPTMTMKNAALLALICVALLTLLLALDFINTFLGVMRDIVPMMAMLRALIYLLASLSLVVFLYVFSKKQ
jgi:hypothetical protein